MSKNVNFVELLNVDITMMIMFTKIDSIIIFHSNKGIGISNSHVSNVACIVEESYQDELNYVHSNKLQAQLLIHAHCLRILKFYLLYVILT